jgi:hypothetical protein
MLRSQEVSTLGERGGKEGRERLTVIVAAASTSTVAVPSGTGTPTGSTVAPKNGAGRVSGTAGLVGSVGVVFALLF